MSDRFKINPAVYSGMFPLPVGIVDENIKLASAVQLKTILCIFRPTAAGCITEPSEIARLTGYDEEDIKDAMIFWAERGVLIEENASAAASVAPIKKEEEKRLETAEKENIIHLPDPTPEDINIRIEEDRNIAYMFKEIDTIIGRTIGYSGRVMLLKLVDELGLPVEVIFTLAHYAASKKTTATNQLLSLGKLWAKLEIFSVEAAEEYIEKQTTLQKIWDDFRHLSGIKNSVPTTKQHDCFERWVGVYGFCLEMIFHAYEITVENTGKFNLNYCESILKSWHKNGFKTLDDVEKNEAERAETKQPEKKEQESKSSYDKSKYAGLGLNIKS